MVWAKERWLTKRLEIEATLPSEDEDNTDLEVHIRMMDFVLRKQWHVAGVENAENCVVKESFGFKKLLEVVWTLNITSFINR